MAVNLSPVYGVAGQLFDNNGNPLAGGKIYTYLAGTTTNAATYTSSTGNIAHSNPIVLDGAGRVPSGEIWLTDGISYKFVVEDAASNLIGTYDNLVGINSNFVNFTAQQEIQTATAGQTVFNLTTMQYQPGTNNLSVFVDGVNQYGPGAQYAYVETDSDTVTFVSGLHVGASVKFTTSQINTSGGQTAAQTSFVGFKGQIGTVQDLADDDGSDWIGFEQAGSSAIAISAQEKMQQIVSVLDFGAVGDGLVDDASAIQNALDSLSSKGGCVELSNDGQYYIGSNLNIPNGVILKGKIELPGKFVAGNNSSASFNLIGSSIFLDDTATINIGDGAGLRGVNIIRNGMSFPSANASAFAGTAITVNGDDAYVGYCSITGFNQGITSDGFQRPHFEWLYMDNQNGIEITNCGDVARITNVHMWPFGVYFNASPVNYERTGNAFYLHDSVDGPMLSNCFAYGYENGFYFKNAATISCVNCFADNTGGYAGSAGWLFEGNINGFQATSCVAYSCDNGIYVNMNTGQYIKISGFTISNSDVSGIFVEGGNVDAIGNVLYTTVAALKTDSTSSIIRFDYNTMAAISGSPVESTVITNNVFIGQNNSRLDGLTGTLAGGSGSIILNSLASASTINPRSIDQVINVTGTTNINKITGGWAGRKLTLRFTGVLTINTASGTVDDIWLSGGTNFTTAANATLTLIHTGTGGQWFEIGRSA